MKDLKNKNLVLAAIAREMNFWYDVSLKTDSNGVHVRISQGTPLYGNRGH